MTTSVLHDALSHHVWATLRVIEACTALTADQLRTSVPGTYGSILDTLRHLVGADASYLAVLSGGRTPRIDEADMELVDLGAVMERHKSAWTEVLAGDLDADAVLVRRRDDGSENHSATGIRLAQALHHGTDHRSQVCTALTALGIEPPPIDVWDYGAEVGRTQEVPPA